MSQRQYLAPHLRITAPLPCRQTDRPAAPLRSPADQVLSDTTSVVRARIFPHVRIVCAAIFTNTDSYVLYRIVPLSMTLRQLSDSESQFQGHSIV